MRQARQRQDRGSREGMRGAAACVWSPPAGGAAIEAPIATLGELSDRVMDGFRIYPWGGVEIGGLLLGRRSGERVSIEAFRVFECEHQYGPEFELSAGELTEFERLLDRASQPDSPDGLLPVGWYHSSSRRQIGLSEADRRLHQRFWREPWQVAMLLKRTRNEPVEITFFAQDRSGELNLGYPVRRMSGDDLLAPLQAGSARMAGPDRGARNPNPGEAPASVSIPAPEAVDPERAVAPPEPLGSLEAVPEGGVERGGLVATPPDGSAHPEQGPARVPDPAAGRKDPAGSDAKSPPPTPIASQPEPEPHVDESAYEVVMEPVAEHRFLGLTIVKKVPVRKLRAAARVPGTGASGREAPQRAFVPSPAPDGNSPAGATPGSPLLAVPTLPAFSPPAPSPISSLVPSAGVPGLSRPVAPPENPFHSLGLTGDPFATGPDVQTFVPLDQYNEALATLFHRVVTRSGFVALIGPPGTGKSLVLQCLMRQFQAHPVKFAYLFHPTITVSEFYELLAHDLDLPARGSKPSVLIAFKEYLVREASAERITALIVDDAHKLSGQVLEEVEMLSNLEAGDGRLFPVVFAAAPDFEQRIQTQELSGLHYRLVNRARLRPLQVTETAEYIRKRLAHAGLPEQSVFSQPLLNQLHQCTLGVPRAINAVCGRLLELCVEQDARQASPSMLMRVLDELRMNRSAEASAGD